MGVTLQQYRSRIGAFNQARFKSNAKIKLGSKTVLRKYQGMKLSLLILLCLASSCIFKWDQNKKEFEQRLQTMVNYSLAARDGGNQNKLCGESSASRSWLEDNNFAARYTYMEIEEQELD